MLQVDLRELAQGPVTTTGELPADDPAFAGLDVALAGPVQVSGRLQATGEGRYYWHGAIRARVTGQCTRCLRDVAAAVASDVGVLYGRDAEALEDPDAYPIAADAGEIDLRPAVREELLLAAPRFLLCRDDCRGLCPRCGKDLNAGPCGCPPDTDQRWAGLAALKDRFRDERGD